MIGALVLALQLAAARPAVLSVRAPGATTSVALAETNIGAALPIARLAPVIPLSVRTPAPGRFAISVAGIELGLIDEVPFATIGGAVVPLAQAPFTADGQLYVPLELVTELLPRFATRLRYDPRRTELRLTPDAADAPLVLASAAAPRRASPSRPRGRAHRRLVVVDAGHGGPDNGMTGPIGTRNKVKEKTITLAVAKKLASALEARGVDVIMTRRTDTLIALSDRGRIANEQHGDVFVSIHVNAANPEWKHPEESRGFETYFLAEAKTEDAKRVERMENESIRFETDASAEKDDPLNFVINDMAQNEHLRESSELAELIQRQLGTVEPGPSRGVKQAGFRVLVTAFMPAVLVEIGFGTNAPEARYLTTAARQREIANAVATAVMQYLDHYERRLGASTP